MIGTLLALDEVAGVEQQAAAPEIAEHLRQPLGTIKARIRRGMMTLRDQLEGPQ